MSISEADRHEIYELIEQASDDRVANNVMTLFPPVGWPDVATKTDIRSLQTEIGSVRIELRSVESGLRADVRALEANLRVEMHQSIRIQTWALVAWTTGLAGLIVALAR